MAKFLDTLAKPFFPGTIISQYIHHHYNEDSKFLYVLRLIYDNISNHINYPRSFRDPRYY